MPKQKLTDQQKEQIITLASQGMYGGDIATQLQIDRSRVGGVIGNAVNRGFLIHSSMRQASNLTNATPPIFPDPSDDGHAWKAGSEIANCGFVLPTKIIEYKIERVSPRDGILKIQYEAIQDVEVCSYGEGAYRVWMRAGDTSPVYRDVQVSKAFGPPRFQTMETNDLPHSRNLGEIEDDPVEGQTIQGFYHPELYEPDHDQDWLNSECARHEASLTESIAVTAISTLSEMYKRRLDWLEKRRGR